MTVVLDELLFVICFSLLGCIHLKYPRVKSNELEENPQINLLLWMLFTIFKNENFLTIAKCSRKTWESISSIRLFSIASVGA